MSQLIGPTVVAKGVLTTAKTGVHQGRTIGSASQLGGAMVIAPGGAVLYEQLAKDASDNASPGAAARGGPQRCIAAGCPIIRPMATTFESGLHAPFAGTVIAIAHDVGEPVAAGTALVILEAMKMEHEVIAERDGVVAQLEVEVGETVDEGQLLAVIAPGDQARAGHGRRLRRV